MTSYDSYNRQGFGGGGGGGDGGGGFMSASQQGSQGGQGGGKSYAEESLRPVTIKQLLDSEEEYPGADFLIDGQKITQVTFVGQVRNINPQPTNITYRIDDGTGTVEVKKWVDADRPDDAAPGYEPDQHVRVWGRLKSYNGKKHVGAHFMRAVTDFNEVGYHLLEAAYVHLYITKGPVESGGAAGVVKQQNSGEDSMFVDQGAGAGMNKVAGCSPQAQKMYNYLHNSEGGNEGMHLNLIANGTGLTSREVLRAADELLGTGIIYTTVDDETWAILDY